MINKYEAYWIWEKNPDGTYTFDCIGDEHRLCGRDCPFGGRPFDPAPCDYTSNVPTWNEVRKIMQEVYGV